MSYRQRLRHHLAFAVLGIFIISFTGCGGGVQQAAPRREVPGISGAPAAVSPPDETARAENIEYHGETAVRLSNGMVTVVVAPAQGGRIVEYTFGGRNMVWHDPTNGAVPTGGYGAWVLPAGRWSGVPGPIGEALAGAQWQAKITSAAGRVAEVTLTSPEEAADGLRIQRTVKLYGGSSRLSITEEITNTGRQPVSWGMAQATFVPGALQDGARYSEDARVFFPLNPESKLPGGYALHSGSGADQLQVIEPSLARLGYRGVEARFITDSTNGWMTYTDDRHGISLVQRFSHSALGEYPDNAVMAVHTRADLPAMVMEIFNPVRTLKPKESISATLDWYVTALKGPVMDTSEVAAVSVPLTLERRENVLKLTGTLGVFAPGRLAVIVRNKDGMELGQPVFVDVTPAKAVELALDVPEDESGTQVVVELRNESGTPLGTVATVPMGVSPARVTQETEPAAETDADG